MTDHNDPLWDILADTESKVLNGHIPNHIHDGGDLMPAIRITLNHHTDPTRVRRSERELTLDEQDDLDEIHKELEAFQRARLSPHQVELLAYACVEAELTAIDEGFPRVAKRTKEIRHHLEAGRVPTVLVVGLCKVCWPNA